MSDYFRNPCPISSECALSTADQKCLSEPLFVVEKSIADKLLGQQHAKLKIARIDDRQNLLSNLMVNIVTTRGRS